MTTATASAPLQTLHNFPPKVRLRDHILMLMNYCKSRETSGWYCQPISARRSPSIPEAGAECAAGVIG